jgi:hypothetical protein
MGKKLKKTDQVKIVQMKRLGYSNRSIAVHLWNNTQLESRIRRYLSTLKPIDYAISSDSVMQNPIEENLKIQDNLKILYYDVEISPTQALVWGRFKQNISSSQIVSHWYVLTQSWAWSNGEITGSRLTHQEALDEDDEGLITQIWNLLDEADVVIGHNLRRFDIKKINARFAYYGFPAPSPYKIIDTLEIAKVRFGFPSNKLNDLCEYLGIGVKADVGGMETWAKAIKGCDEALDHMLEYNHQDINLTRQLYNRLKSFDNNAVNLAVMRGGQGKALCPTCTSDDIVPMEGKYVYTPNSRYQAYRCRNCNTNMRSTSRDKSSGNAFVRVVI